MIRHYYGVPAACLGAWMLLSSAVFAEESGALPDITLKSAIAHALEGNPRLRGTEHALKAADAKIAQAELRPNPRIRLDLENFAGSGVVSGTDALETTLTLSQVLELGDKRSTRVSAAEAARTVVSVDREIVELDVIAEVARRFLHVVSDQEQLALTQRATQLAEDTVGAVETRVKAAKSPEVELLRARIALTRAKIKQEHAEHELQASKQKLAALWGDTGVKFGTARADLLSLPDVSPFPALAGKLKQNPDNARYLNEARLHESEKRVAESKQRPDIELGGGVRRLELSNDHALVASISVPLFSARLAAPDIAAASARQHEAESRYEAAVVDAHARLFALYQELQHARMETTLLRDEVAPQTEEALRQTEYAYERGRYSYLEWADAQRELIEVRLRLIESATNTHLLMTEVERLTGQSAVRTNPE
jgi:outer membrane protein, heavy metal efflux system